MDKSTGPGWEKIVNTLLIYCELHNIIPLQIKEKFGSLRFYYASRNGNAKAEQALDNLIAAAEIKAEQICEWCGDVGQPRKTNWRKTLCDQHETEWNDGKRWWLTADGKRISI